MSFGLTLQGRREKTGRQHPHHFLEQKNFFHVISENITFLHVKNIWDLSLFIEQDISDKK